MTDTNVYFLNTKVFSIIQVIQLKDHLSEKKDNNEDNEYSFWKKEANFNYERYHNFRYVEFLSENKLSIIYEGYLGYLDDIDKLNHYIKFNHRNGVSYIDIINNSNCIFNSLEDTEDYIFMLIYNKNDDGFFELLKIIVLIKRIIYVKEVSYISGKHWEYEDNDIYYKFYFDSLNQYSENKCIISFKCRVKPTRNLYYFYVDDKDFTNETVYFILDINDYTIKKKLCSSTENTRLIKKNKKFYFFFNESQECSNKIKKVLKKFEFFGVKTNIFDLKQIDIVNNIVLGWNNNTIYYGKIYNFPNCKLDIIKEISKDYNILSVVPKNMIIIYNDRDIEEESFNEYVKEEDNDKKSYTEEKDNDNIEMDEEED